MGTTLTWFPGHMAKAVAALTRVVRGVDLLLEVRDARVPLSSANPKLEGLMQGKRRIVVLNKADLVAPRSCDAALRCLRQQGLTALAASATKPGSVHEVLQAAVGWIGRERAACELSIVMVLGLPNSGKSSLINGLKLAAKATGALGGEAAYQRRARVGDTPGLTRQVSGFEVAARPRTYVLDTPGIMLPAVPSHEVGLRLALAGAIKDAIVGEEALVRYLLHLLHTQPRHRAALRRSGPLRPAAVARGGRAGAGGGAAGAAQLARMRAALLAAAAYDPAADLVAAGTAAAGPAAAAAAAAWHPGDSDVEAQEGAAAWRLEVLLRELRVAGQLNPSAQQGACLRLLRAFRAGQLGKFMLDEVE